MDDMQDLLKQFSSMIEKNGIPDNLKEAVGSLNLNEQDNFSNSTSSNFNNIDMETILRLKSVMDGMNSKDDPRANLLLSLKPYLKDSRKNKIDQYMQFLNMSKVFEMMQNSGGDKK